MRTLVMRSIGALLATMALVARASGAPVLVDRVVALVDDDVITLSEVRARLRPFVSTAHVATNAEQQRAMLEKMIDEAIERREAARVNVTVTKEDVDQGLAAVAEQNKITVPELLIEAKKLGWDEGPYREDLARQILSMRLQQLRTEERDAWLKAKRAQVYVDVRL